MNIGCRKASPAGPQLIITLAIAFQPIAETAFGADARTDGALAPGIAVLADHSAAGEAPVAEDNSTATAPSAEALSEIVVTAQKRKENLQSVPVAISAFGAEQLAAEGITDLRGLAGAVPNFHFGLYSGNAQVAIRGLGYDSTNPGAEGRVAVHLDGVYLSRPAEIMSAFYDVDRIEVLRGPQGTLYGRNATAGSVNIVTKNPSDEFTGFVRQTVGNYNLTETEAAIGGGITDVVSGRVATILTNRSGYGTNIITGSGVDDANQRSVRGKVRFKSGDLDVILNADYHFERDNNNAAHFFGPGRPDIPVVALLQGGIASPDNRDVAQTDDPHNHKVQRGFGADATFDMGEVALRSVTGYRYSHYDQNGTFDAVSGNFQRYQELETSHQYSEELQLSNNGTNFKWLLGGYYFHEKIHTADGIQYPGSLFGLPHFPILQGYATDGTGITDAAALFGQTTFKIGDSFSVTLGERLGWERKKKVDEFQFDLDRPYSPTNPIIPLIGPQADQTHNYYQTPKIDAQYQITNDVIAYATWAKGYKSGGFDLGGVSPAYRPEKLTDYEIGLKADWFDHRLRTNLAAFYYDYKDIQISVVRSTIIVIENAAKAKVRGFEAEITALPYEGVELNASGGFLGSKYQDFLTSDTLYPERGIQNLSGNQLEEAPKFSADLGASYGWDQGHIGRLTLRADWRYKSRVYFTPFENDTLSSPAHDTFNASLDFKDPSNHWTGSIWGKNITNNKVIAYLINSSDFAGYATIGYLDPPATFGFTIGYAF